MPSMPQSHNQRLKEANKELLASMGAKVITPEMQYNLRRGSSAARGYDATWRKYRRVFLLKNPICVDPLGEHPGVVVAANVVDHITAHKGDKVRIAHRSYIGGTADINEIEAVLENHFPDRTKLDM